jgi:chemotaxis protein histidine kinase CheA
MGDGRVALILDLAGVVRQAQRRDLPALRAA